MMVYALAVWWVVFVVGIALWVLYVRYKRSGNERATERMRRGAKYVVLVLLVAYTLFSIVAMIDRFSIGGIPHILISLGLTIFLGRRWLMSRKSDGSRHTGDM